MFKIIVRTTYLNAVHLLRLVKTNNIDKILIKINYNVTKKQFNFIAKTTNYKYLVLRAIVILITIHETTTY